MGIIIKSVNADPSGGSFSDGRTSSGIVDAYTAFELPKDKKGLIQTIDLVTEFDATELDPFRNLIGVATGSNPTTLIGYSNSTLKSVWTEESQVGFYTYSGDSTITGETWSSINSVGFLCIKSGSTFRGCTVDEVTAQFPDEHVSSYITNYQTLSSSSVGVPGLDLYCQLSSGYSISYGSEGELTAQTLMTANENTWNSIPGNNDPWDEYQRFVLSDFAIAYNSPETTSYQLRPISATTADQGGNHWPWPVNGIFSGFNYLVVMYKFSKRISSTENKIYYQIMNFELPSRFSNLGDTYYGIDQDTLKFRFFHGTTAYNSWNPEVSFNADIIDFKNSGFAYTVADKPTAITVTQDDVDNYGIDWYFPGGDGLAFGSGYFVPIYFDDGLGNNVSISVKDQYGLTYTTGNSSTLIYAFSTFKTYSSAGMTSNQITKLNMSGTAINALYPQTDSGACVNSLYVLHTKLYDVDFLLSAGSRVSNSLMAVKSKVEPISVVMSASNRVNSSDPATIRLYVDWGDGNTDEVYWNTGGTSTAKASGITHIYQSAEKTFNVYVSAATVEQLDSSNPGYTPEVFEDNLSIYTQHTMNTRHDGLCYWWRFDNDDWKVDTMGNSNILDSVVPVPNYQTINGIVGGCISGSSAVYQVENPIYVFDNPQSGMSNYLLDSNISNDWTLACWVKDSDTGTTNLNDRKLIAKLNGLVELYSFGYTVELDGTHYLLYGNTQTKFPSVVWASTLTINDNVWHHITYRKKDNKIYFYIDGTLVYQESYTDTFSREHGNTYLMHYVDDAYIDDFRIYNRALTAAEIKDLSEGLVFSTDFYAPILNDSTSVTSNSSADPGVYYFVATDGDYLYTPYIEQNLSSDALTNSILYRQHYNNSLYKQNLGYLDFPVQASHKTPSYRDEWSVFNGNGNSHLTAEFTMYTSVFEQATNAYLWSIDTGTTVKDAIFAIEHTPSSGQGRIRLIVNTTNNSPNVQLTTYLIIPIDVDYFKEGSHQYVIQYVGENKRYAYRLIRNGTVIKTDLVTGIYDYSLNNSSNGTYNVRIKPQYNSLQRTLIYFQNLKIWKSIRSLDRIHDNYNLTMAIEENGSVRSPLGYNSGVTITTGISLDYKTYTVFGDYNEMGVTRGMIACHKFDGNFVDSSFCGSTSASHPDGKHRYFEEGINKRTNRGLYVYGDIYNSGGTYSFLDQGHAFNLTSDILSAGSVFLAIKDFDVSRGSIGTENLEIVSAGEGLLTINAAYELSIATEKMTISIGGIEGPTPVAAITNYEKLDGWNTYVISWDESTAYLYKNALLQQSSSHSMVSPITQLRLLNNTSAESNNFGLSCVVGELRAYNRKLNVSEVIKLDNAFRKDMASIDSAMTLYSTGHIKD